MAYILTASFHFHETGSIFDFNCLRKNTRYPLARFSLLFNETKNRLDELKKLYFNKMCLAERKRVLIAINR